MRDRLIVEEVKCCQIFSKRNLELLVLYSLVGLGLDRFAAIEDLLLDGNVLDISGVILGQMTNDDIILEGWG